MIQYQKKNNRFATQNILEYMAVLLVILEGRSIYTYMSINLINDALLLGILFLLGFLILFTRKNNIHPLKSLGFILLYGCFLLPPLIKILPQNYLSYICRFYFIIVLFAVYFACNKQNYFNVLSKYVNWIVLLSVFSVVMWLLCSMLQILPLNSVVPCYWGPKIRLINGWHYLYFETQSSSVAGISLRRNSGIFTEAPMHNFHLCLALLIALFLEKKKSIMKLSILSLTILTTLTTTGQLFLLGSWFLKFLLSDFSAKCKVVVWCMGIIGGIVLLFAIDSILDNKKTAGNSYAIRESDIKKELRMWKENPIMGVGYGNSTNKDSSNSAFYTLANGGAYLFSFYFFSILIYPLLKRKSIKEKIFFMSFFLLFSITLVPRSVIVFLIMSFSLSRIISKK